MAIETEREVFQVDAAEQLDLNALEISDLIEDSSYSDETLSQVMAASCTTTGCTTSSSSSSSS
ncbi:thiocillin/thiostrepton family thiazolyl peptide [Streptomyces africanus]|uniref:thiocillin/thiostrepton family thiazolyl peptide n=1 Tax=Streptomyces africanus TaxID=231024 RepID=UPI000A36C812|nr:thiocillin/thiostrepton family thiazolyl peptide [Streptomyces africanus]